MKIIENLFDSSFKLLTLQQIYVIGYIKTLNRSKFIIIIMIKVTNCSPRAAVAEIVW